jgi:hypothetical protein
MTQSPSRPCDATPFAMTETVPGMSLLAARSLCPPRANKPKSLLNLLENTLLELPLNLLALVIRTRLAVQSHQGTKVELGGLEQLDLSDVDLLGGVSAHRKFPMAVKMRGFRLTFWRG